MTGPARPRPQAAAREPLRRRLRPAAWGAWREQGQEPDYRFSLANERTFLAWIRTALAMLAGAVAAAQLATDLGPPAVTWTLVLLLASLATGIAATSYHRWRQHELAMRLGRPLPSPVLLPVLAAGVTLLCLLVLAGLLLSR